MQVSLVPSEYVDQCWPNVKDYLAGAAEYTYGRYTVDDILDCIKEYGFLLWVAFDDDGVIKGAVVTDVAQYPRKKYLVMTFCGGVELEKWKDQMLSILQKWAFDTHCDGIEATARPGWAKIFKTDGHVALWHTFQLPAGSEGVGNG